MRLTKTLTLERVAGNPRGISEHEKKVSRILALVSLRKALRIEAYEECPRLVSLAERLGAKKEVRRILHCPSLGIEQILESED